MLLFIRNLKIRHLTPALWVPLLSQVTLVEENWEDSLPGKYSKRTSSVTSPSIQTDYPSTRSSDSLSRATQNSVFPDIPVCTVYKNFNIDIMESLVVGGSFQSQCQEGSTVTRLHRE